MSETPEPRVVDWRERAETAEREAAAARRYAEAMRNFCSPHGVSVHYADQLTQSMDRAREGTES